MRVLLLAEACNPDWTSVPLVGFNMAAALAARPGLDLTLVTNARNRAALEAHPISRRVSIEFIDTEWISGPAYRLGTLLRGGRSLGWTTAMALNWPGYVSFERQVGRRFGPDLRAGRFDLVHRLTPLSPTLPSLLAGRFETPLLLGPLNGGLPWPREFPELRAKEREWLVPLRRLSRHLPGWKRTFREAAGVITASRHTATEIPASCHGRRFHLPENGIDPDRFAIADDWTPPGRAWEFVTVGRLVPYKGMDLAIEALATVDGTSRLTIIGDGPERKRLLSIASRLNVSDRVSFTGWLPQQELAARLRSSQAFLFPTLREFGGGVALEAMASGLPSIIVDYGGPAELVDGDCGIKVPMSSRETLVPALAGAMRQLLGDWAMSAEMGRTAAQRVRDRHVWSAKADHITRIYRQLVTTAPGHAAQCPPVPETQPC